MKSPDHSPLIIACEAIVNEVLPWVKESMAFETIDAGLHVRANHLKSTLQASVAKADGYHDPIILGYGLCGNAVVGLTAQRSTLIVPRVDDCIAMMLGSAEAHKAIMKEYPRSYFLSRGWIDSKITLLDEWQELADRHGRERALWVQKKMFCHYRHLIYVETDSNSPARYDTAARKAASHIDLAYLKKTGTPEMLKALLHGPWDHRFVVKPPGNDISLSDFSASRDTKTSVKSKH